MAMSRRKLLVVFALFIVLAGMGGVAWMMLSRVKPIVTQNILGQKELCTSCHPVQKHPKVIGHAELKKIGCTPCHGGSPTQIDEKLAHAPALGEAREPFLPKGQYEVGCARCHILGQVKGMKKLVAGQRAFLKGTCVGCHGPGHRPPEIGPTLMTVPQKDVAYLERWLMDSRSVLSTASMWSIRDATYHGLFADNKSGNANLQALITYVLMVEDHQQRKRFAAHSHRPSLRIDGSCVSCHKGSSTKVEGKPHRCTMLKKNAALDCKRCHKDASTAPRDKNGRCPQIAASAYLCQTCHLRQNDGADALIKRADPLGQRLPSSGRAGQKK
jgi:hypothetical protein